jgi:hypothetical protein
VTGFVAVLAGLAALLVGFLPAGEPSAHPERSLAPGSPAAVEASPRPGGTGRSIPSAGVRRLSTAEALAVLHAWDAARARAYAAGDSRALGSLYAPTSGTGAADLARLRAYTRRDLRVSGLRMQVLDFEVLRQRRQLLELRVTDRIQAATVVGSQRRWTLPRDQASGWTMVLRAFEGTGRWQVTSVSR